MDVGLVDVVDVGLVEVVDLGRVVVVDSRSTDVVAVGRVDDLTTPCCEDDFVVACE